MLPIRFLDDVSPFYVFILIIISLLELNKLFHKSENTFASGSSL